MLRGTAASPRCVSFSVLKTVTMEQVDRSSRFGRPSGAGLSSLRSSESRVRGPRAEDFTRTHARAWRRLKTRFARMHARERYLALRHGLCRGGHRPLQGQGAVTIQWGR